MADAPVNLAIETSSRHGCVSLGIGDRLIETVRLGPQRRHAVELMPAIDRLCAAHELDRANIREVYLSIGPGSFTGLRIGVTTAKMFGRALGSQLVAVPTLDVIVENAPANRPHVAVCLNAKRAQCFTGIYRRDSDQWLRLSDPAILTPAELLETAPRPLAVIGDHLPDYHWPDDVVLLDARLAAPDSAVVWRLGRAMAASGCFTDPMALKPLYVRLPEAEEVWQAKHAGK